VNRVTSQNLTTSLDTLLNTYFLPSITTPQDREAAYRYVYALAMADLNINEAEGGLLTQLHNSLGLPPDTYDKAQAAVLAQYQTLHRALAAISLG